MASNDSIVSTDNSKLTMVGDNFTSLLKSCEDSCTVRSSMRLGQVFAQIANRNEPEEIGLVAEIVGQTRDNFIDGGPDTVLTTPLQSLLMVLYEIATIAYSNSCERVYAEQLIEYLKSPSILRLLQLLKSGSKSNKLLATSLQLTPGRISQILGDLLSADVVVYTQDQQVKKFSLTVFGHQILERLLIEDGQQLKSSNTSDRRKMKSKHSRRPVANPSLRSHVSNSNTPLRNMNMNLRISRARETHISPNSSKASDLMALIDGRSL